MAAPDAVLELVERFARNREQYLNPAYNETQVRREFLDPLFGALGWDVDNRAGYAQQYKDVVHEDAIKVGRDARAPDYSFRIGGQRKFFVEAKKPAVNLRDDPAPAFQLRRYAWSAKLPLSLLTDFQELAVYDCRVKPTVSDRPSVARTLYVACEQYEERWDEIASVFSKEAILQGSFDRYAESTKAKKGTADVDKAFLSEIELWRDALARNLALRNPALSQRELNYAVQTTIDRIIFLRICEDRGIEVYGRLRGLLNGGDTYGRLRQLFWEADQRYNSGLFHFADEKGRAGYADRLTPALTIDDKVFKDILRRLYYPESPYEFSVLPADILGQVYEQFLGKVIRLTAGHQAKVEDKPEVKKAGGVYYTPTYIVDYIVRNTVGRLLEGKTPKQAASLRILDPACGSGSFLIGAYQCLLDWHLAAYAVRPEKHRKELVQGRGGEWQLATAEKKRILQANIYGVDIDAQAVETTKLSLLLKVLEGETSESIDAQLSFLHERALPDLATNIKCGNSLVGTDFLQRQGRLDLDDEELEQIGIFDWASAFPGVVGAGGFDAVIGNPPYVRVHRLDPGFKEYLWGAFTSFAEKGDLYACFVERGLSLLREGGFISFITPNTWSSLQSFRHLRRLVLDEADIECMVRTPTKVFRNATVRTLIFVLRRRGQAPPSASHMILDMTEDGSTEVSGEVLRSAIEAAHQLNLLLESDRAPAAPVCEVTVGVEAEFAYGFKTGDDSLFLADSRRGATWLPCCRSADVQRLRPLKDTGWVDYRPDAMKSHRRTARPGEPGRFRRPKIVVARMGRALVATIDLEGHLVKDAMLLFRPDDDIAELELLAGILSSTYLERLYTSQFITIDVLKNALLSLPLPGRLAELVATDEGREIIDLVKRLTADETSEAVFRARRTRIDYLAEALYVAPRPVHETG